MRLHAIKAFYDTREGMVTLEDDVLSIVRQVNELCNGRVFVLLDETCGMYHFVEQCEDHTERLIFTTELLDYRCLERLQKADSHGRWHHDPYDEAEREQDRLQEASDRQYREYLGEAGEHLAHALKKEGKEPRLPLTVPITREVNLADR